MGVGMLALAVFVPAIVIAVILAFWFAIAAASAGHTLGATASLASLVMIASPLFFAAFATRPQADDENPFFLIEYGIFPSVVLGVAVLDLALALRRRHKLLAASTLLVVPLVFLAIASGHGIAATIDKAGAAGGWLFGVGIILLAAYPVIWVLAFRELSEYVAPRLAKPQQG